jgi:hypothetical protein
VSLGVLEIVPLAASDDQRRPLSLLGKRMPENLAVERFEPFHVEHFS